MNIEELEIARSMDIAPKDGTLVRLLVEFTEHDTEDSDGPSWTVGAWVEGNDEWLFAGWCWTHDHFTQGEGTPVGWLPMLTSADIDYPYLLSLGQQTIKMSQDFIEAMGNDMEAAGCEMQTTPNLAITNPRAEIAEKSNQEWKENVEYLLKRCPYTIRVREGGGSESLVDSLITTFMAMENKLKGNA